MSYKFSKGSQVIGDLKAADDTQRDTLIDFGEDKIDFQTSGSVRLTVDNDGVSIPEGNMSVSGNIKLDSSVGRIGVGMHLGGGTDGASTPVYVNGEDNPQYRIHVIGDATNGAAFATETYADAQGGPRFRFIKGRGTPSSPAAVSANDEAGRLEFYSHTGSNTMMLSAMIVCFVDADGDGKLSFRATHNGADNEAFYCHDNRVYFVDQVRIGNVIAPTTNGGTNIGGAGARFEQIHGNNFLAYESVKIDDTFIYGQDGYGVTFGIDYAPNTDVSGDDANSSHMSALNYASTNTLTRNVAFNLIKTGSHTAGMGTYGTGNSNEKIVFYGQYNTAGFEFRNNIGVEPMRIQSGSLLMNLDASGNLETAGDIKATGKINAKQRFINTAKYNSTDNSQQYVRWDAAGSNSTPGVNNKFVAPCDGELLSVNIRATTAANGTNIAFHKASNGTANLNTTATETVGIDIASNNTTYQATFSGSTFSAGEILGISINPSSTPNDVNISCVWLFDWNS